MVRLLLFLFLFQSLQAAETPAPQLKLEASVEGKNPLYPGQRTTFVYRYSFEGNIVLTKEVLPLLDAEGFIKIGEKEITDSSRGQTSLSRIAQEVEAVKPGTYTFGPSVAAGYARNPGIEPPTQPTLYSEAPIVTVTVLPFPEQGKPASFNGAVGDYQFNTDLTSPTSVELGDEMTLILTVSGKGNLASIPMPSLCCQPGFGGFFQLSDLPPLEQVVNDTKKFTVKFRVLTDQTHGIPKIEFSFFEPETSRYVVRISDPISIAVKPMVPIPLAVTQHAATPAASVVSSTAPVVDIAGLIPLEPADLYNKPLGTWTAFFAIPLAAVLLLFQLHWRKVKNQRRAVSAETLLKEAFKGPCNFNLLEQALNLAPGSEKIHQESAQLLAHIEEERFSRGGHIDVNAIRAQAYALIAKIIGNKQPVQESRFLRPFFYALLTLGVVVVCLWAVTTFFPAGDKRIGEAEAWYHKGEQTTTIAEKSEAFNQALNQFLQLDLEYHPMWGSGRLYYAIGNTFFQLNEYPLALLYYARAEALDPAEGKVWENAAKARERLALPPATSPWHLPLPRQIHLFLLIAIAAFLSCSGAIWYREKQWKQGSVVLVALCGASALAIGAMHYFTPAQVMLIHAVELRQEPADASPKVGERPLMAGTTLDVLSASAEADWLKAAVGNTFGYVPQESVRVLGQ